MFSCSLPWTSDFGHFYRQDVGLYVLLGGSTVAALFFIMLFAALQMPTMCVK